MNKVNIRKYAGNAKNSPYDVLASYNREYQRLLKVYPELIKKYASSCENVLDLGCGTGNFTLIIYETLKENHNLKIRASDVSNEMIEIFNYKINKYCLQNIISTEISDARDINSYKPNSFDLINITHTLNFTGEPKKVLKNINVWLKPNGILFAVDIGRELIVKNWSKTIFKWAYEDFYNNGYRIFAIIPTIHHFIKYRAAKKENINFEKGQISGRYPLHTSDQFKNWIEDAGFEILYFSNDFYKDHITGIGLDDFVVAKKK